MRVFFTNLGCKLNQAENDRLARDFLAAGHQLAAALGEADLHVVNSCTVTAAAARSSRQAARAATRGAPGRRPRTVLTGCYATASPAEAARLAGVDLVVPNAAKEHLLERVLQAFPEAAAAALPDVPATARLPHGNTRALVKIEDGCDMRCSFCIIPSTRGRQRSRPPADVVNEVRGLALSGYREIVLTGVQISAYRGGTLGTPAAAVRRRRNGLAGLVREVLAALPAAAAIPAARLRLTSIAPWDLDDELLALWEDCRLCRHLHLSLQSGATATLRRMRRPYTAEIYGRLVEKVRAAVPGVAVTTDVIVGFPGETAAELEESLATVTALGFAKVHVFPFSPRPGTAAATLPGAVPPPELRQRMARMLAVAARAELAFRLAHLGRREIVLWERPRGGTGQGLTDNYIRVFSPEGAGLWNRLGEVELLALAPGGMVGRVVQDGVS
ncbi:MAG TPA: MiaB/RimO family radical SAM methylthiotransferase [Thermoanaerobaculia bacterium]|nr:MiaB/RimO family radical SAM methylthiotransferase [Thermoanaerobaculia bacterium]